MRTPAEDTRVTLRIALILWFGALVASAASGVFAKLSPAELDALLAFVAVFAAASYGLDRGVREALRDAPHLAGIAVALDIGIVALLASLAIDARSHHEAMATPEYAVAALLFVPLALLSHLALAERRHEPRAAVRSPARKSPAGSPAAP